MDPSGPQGLPPIPLALIVCDWAHKDSASDKWTLLGLFSVISTDAVPFTHPLFWVYFAFTDAKRIVPLRIRLVDVNEEHQPLVELVADIEAESPLAVNEVVAPIPTAIFPTFGEYRLQAYTFGELLIERRIMVMDRGQKEESDD